MSDRINDGGPAFPYGHVNPHTGQFINGYGGPGMNLRDYFAASPSASQYAQYEWENMPVREVEAALGQGYAVVEAFAYWHYKFADAMLAERQKGGGQ